MKLLREIGATLFLQLHDGDAAAALFGRRGRRIAATSGCCRRNPLERALQLAGAVAVNHADGPLIGQQRLVEKALGARDAPRPRVQPMTFKSAGVASRGCSSTFTLTRAVTGRSHRRSTREIARWRASVCRARPPRRPVVDGRDRPPRARGRRRDAVADRGARASTARRRGTARGACRRRLTTWSTRRARLAARRAGVARRDGVPSPASCAIAFVLALRSAMTSSISRRACRTCARAPRSRRRRNVSSRWRAPPRARASAPSAASTSSRSRAASRRSCSSARMSRSDLRRDARRAAPRARSGFRARARHDRRVQAQARRHLEREAAPRRTVDELIGRRERLGVETECGARRRPPWSMRRS